MSDEAAFLAALKTNPADDTARLVYADWLDEHDEPQKAEYLRGVVELVCALRETTADTAPTLVRLEALAEAIPVDWRLTTAARFALVLESYDPSRKIHAIKIVREMTGMGLAEAKRFVEGTPSGFLHRMTPEAADSVTHYFGPGRLCINPDVTNVLLREPTATTFDVYAELTCPNWDVDSLPPEALDEFRTFLSKAGSTEQITQADGDYPVTVTLGTGFGYSRAQNEMGRWREFLPPFEATSRWMMLVYPSLRLHTS